MWDTAYRTLLAVCSGVALVSGHGRLMEPPSRNAMWRFGYPNPVNYNDNEVFCGGYGIQFDKNDGKCGVCGDDYSKKSPRIHESNGKFGNGIIGKRYVQGDLMEVEVDLTTNHWGYFELKLCPTNDKNEIATQECMDQHPLYLADDPTSTKFYIPKDTKKKGYLTYQVRLPSSITCKQCVVQWTYNTGNTWGECEDGTTAIGCGPQEVFRNCADIQIYSLTAGLPPNAITNPNAIYYRDSLAPGGRRQLVVRYQVCVPTSLYRFIPGMDNWCQENCLQYPPRCHDDKCKCIDECEAIGPLKDVEGTDVYCQRNCLRFPSTCDTSECHCFSSEDQEKEEEEEKNKGEDKDEEVKVEFTH